MGIEKAFHANNSVGDPSEDMMEYWDVNSPNTESSKKSTHAGGERKTTLLERSVSPNSKRQPSTDTRQQLHHEYPNAMIMHVCILPKMYDESWQTDMLKPQVRESIIRRAKPKSPESQENPLEAGTIGNNQHPAGEKGHPRLPEGSSVTTGEKSSTCKRMRRNNLC